VVWLPRAAESKRWHNEKKKKKNQFLRSTNFKSPIPVKGYSTNNYDFFKVRFVLGSPYGGYSPRALENYYEGLDEQKLRSPVGPNTTHKVHFSHSC
jgi:hypothetical protein